MAIEASNLVNRQATVEFLRLPSLVHALLERGVHFPYRSVQANNKPASSEEPHHPPAGYVLLRKGGNRAVGDIGIQGIGRNSSYRLL